MQNFIIINKNNEFFRFYLDSLKSKIDSHLFTSSSKSNLVINFGSVESLDVPVGS